LTCDVVYGINVLKRGHREKERSRTVKSTMISHRPLFYLFTVRKHVGQWEER